MLAFHTPYFWNRLAGIGILIVAAVWAFRRHVDVGIEGEPPSFAWKGRAALVAAVFAGALGVILLVWPEWFG